MKSAVTSPLTSEGLRQRAEDRLRSHTGDMRGAFSADDVLHLLHELEVHEIELEIQNEELRQAIREMEHSREAYFRLYDDAPVAYLTVGEKGLITRANLMAVTLLGMPGEEIVGRGVSTFIHPKDRGIYFAMLQRCARDNVRQSAEARLLHQAVAPFHARVEIVASRDIEDHFDGWRLAFMDVSARIRTEEDLRVHAERLEHSNRELQDFAFIASHDLQEPLRKIRIFGDRLKSHSGAALDAEGTHSLDRMCDAAHRLQDMVRDLLAYSRVGTDAEPHVRVNLNWIMREVLSDLRMRVEVTGAVIEVGPLPVIEADPAQMRQLFRNLVSNSLKFCRKEPCMVKIHGEWERDEEDADRRTEGGGTCRIHIEDNGIGFEGQYAEKIFTLFERLHRQGSYEGTGMGLSICRRIVERHGGGITARGKPEEGATIIVTLPMSRRGHDEGKDRVAPDVLARSHPE